MNRKELEHPCKETCSGWQQGYERGKSASPDVIASLVREVKMQRELLERAEGILSNVSFAHHLQWLADYQKGPKE